MILELAGYRDYAEEYTVSSKLQTVQTPLSILPSMADIDVGKYGIDKERGIELLRRMSDVNNRCHMLGTYIGAKYKEINGSRQITRSIIGHVIIRRLPCQCPTMRVADANTLHHSSASNWSTTSQNLNSKKIQNTTEPKQTTRNDGFGSIAQQATDR